MITLNIAPTIKSILGGSSTVSYNKVVLSTISYDVSNAQITAQVKLTSTADTSMQAIFGTLKINAATAMLTIEVEQLDFRRQLALTGPQNIAVQALITNAQNALENGLISIGVVAGTQIEGV